jgi:hypothetical protein
MTTTAGRSPDKSPAKKGKKPDSQHLKKDKKTISLDDISLKDLLVARIRSCYRYYPRFVGIVFWLLALGMWISPEWVLAQDGIKWTKIGVAGRAEIRAW